MKSPADKNIFIGFSFVFFWMFIPVIPVFVPLLHSLNFSMKEFFFLQAYFGLVVAVFEVPSGYFADLYGRANSLRLGSLLAALGFTYLYFSEEMWQLIVYESLVGIGLSLVSGADFSLLYDSLKAKGTGDKKSYTRLVSNFFFILLFAEAISSVLGGFAATHSMSTVILITAIFGWVPFLLSFLLVEPPGKRLQRGQHVHNLKKVISYIVLDAPLIRLIFINMTIWSLSTFCAVWIIQKIWLDQKLTLIWFGIIWAGFQLAAGLMGKLTPKLESSFGPTRLMSIAATMSVLGYLGLALFDSWAAVAVGILFYLSRGLSSVLYKDAMNWKMPSEFRATANSIASLFFRGTFFFIGPVIGLSLDSLGTTATLLIMSSIFFLAMIIIQRPLLKLIKQLNPSD